MIGVSTYDPSDPPQALPRAVTLGVRCFTSTGCTHNTHWTIRRSPGSKHFCGPAAEPESRGRIDYSQAFLYFTGDIRDTVQTPAHGGFPELLVRGRRNLEPGYHFPILTPGLTVLYDGGTFESTIGPSKVSRLQAMIDLWQERSTQVSYPLH